jgi:CRISPR/Cas system-associated exonuclease Cas4 (RecB family)
VEENETILEKFEQHLVALIAQLHDEKQPFIQTTNTDICSYCAYANICMR